MVDRGLEQVGGGDHIVAQIEPGPLDTLADRAARGEVQDPVEALLGDQLPDRRRVEEIGHHQAGIGMDRLAMADREVVDHDHLVAALDQGVDGVAADIAGATGDQGLHCDLSGPVGGGWIMATRSSSPSRGSLGRH